jgi:pimeloyl-ACP methyl ester carboxylesterase
MRSHRPVRALAALVLVILAGCSGGEDDDAGTPAATTAAETSTSTPDVGLPDGFGPGPEGSGIDRFYNQKVSWEDCGTSDECASIWVPLDYSDPDGQAITIEAKRQPTRNQSARRGSLFINPGGPGGSGIDYVDYIGLDSSVTDVYDIVGFDPRGVARSTPVDCLSDADLDAYIASDPTPETDADVKELGNIWTEFTDGCQERSGALLAHVSTVEVARDLDVLRAVVGDDKLNYFGGSYGTYIGATYAGLFPGKVDRLVLDGAVDPLADPLTNQLKQTVGFETALTKYLEYCIDGGACPLGDDVASAKDRLTQLFDDIDASPLPTNSDRELTEGLAVLGVIYPLYSRQTWDIETQALTSALNGDGSVLLAIADAYTHRQADGSYADNAMEVQSPVNCLDQPQDESLADIQAGGAEFVEKAPVFGRVGQWFPYVCSNWPLKPTEDQPDFSAKGAAPIVVVGTTRDPATPYEQAVALAAELDSGVLLSREGDGHGAYGQGNACIDNAVNTYLVTGKAPADGTMC